MNVPSRALLPRPELAILPSNLATFILPEAYFPVTPPNGLGSASSNGPHDVGIENICIILEACDPSHIAAALDPGVQAVSSIYRAV